MVDVKVTPIKQQSGGKTTLLDMVQTTSLPPINLSCSSAAMVRINGKGHLMHADK